MITHVEDYGEWLPCDTELFQATKAMWDILRPHDSSFLDDMWKQYGDDGLLLWDTLAEQIMHRRLPITDEILTLSESFSPLDGTTLALMQYYESRGWEDVAPVPAS